MNTSNLEKLGNHQANLLDDFGMFEEKFHDLIYNCLTIDELE
jgi:hypothetical protein